MKRLLLLITLLLGAPAFAQSTPPSSLLLFGAFTYGGVWAGDAAIVELEEILGRELDVIHWYMSWEHAWDAQLVENVAAVRRLPLISWQSNTVSLEEIASGSQDSYLRSWAQGVREFRRTVYLRPFPEMNGNWNNWHGQAELLVQAWRRMVNLFEQEGAHNVRWVWSPNVTDEPRADWNRMENYFPGNEYVDVLALDGFNWGSTRPWLGWQSAEEVFRSGYDRVVALGDQQPVWFAEIGSTDEGGDKAGWVHDLLLNSAVWFPRLTAIIWFDEDKESDWRIASSPGSVHAFRLLP